MALRETETSKLDSSTQKRAIKPGVLLAVCAASFWVVHSWYEADAFNRLTRGYPTTVFPSGEDVSAVSLWDAMWLNLEVVHQVRK